MKSVAMVINDTSVKQCALDGEIGEVRDIKKPISLRFHKSREKATWCYLHYIKGRVQRTRIGYWPALKTKEALALVPGIMEQLGRGDDVQASQFNTVGELLGWYAARIDQEALKSDSRRKGVLSAIKKHLRPRLEGVKIINVKKSVIDEKLILPLQNDDLKPSSIRQYFAILKRVFTSAHELGAITVNPMSSMKFRDHVQRRIEPKAGRILVSDIHRVLNRIGELPGVIQMLLLMMLMFGTRIGETRQLRWRYIDFEARRLTIPEQITKTGSVHILPLTDHATALLMDYREQCHGEYLFGNNEPCSQSQADKLVRTASSRKWSAHDLRKAARSAWATIGIDYWVSERLLNHKQKGLDLVYIKADSMDVKRAALEQYHTWLFGGSATSHIQVVEKSSEHENPSIFNKVA